MYTFNLQTVLDHRQFIEDNLKKELAECKQQVIAARQQLEALRRKEMDTAAALKLEQEKGLSSDQVIAYHNYLRRLAGHIVRQKEIVDETMALKTAKQNELVEAVKKRQILEKLKDRGLERYNRAMLKREMAFIDEIAVNRFVRKTLNSEEENE